MGKAPSPFVDGFTCLAPSIYIKDGAAPPPEYAKSISGASAHTTSSSHLESSHLHSRAVGSPDLILITSWTGAAGKHIFKYTTSYAEIYPYSPIMVISTSIDDLAFRSMAQKIAALAPAVGFIQGRTGGGGGGGGVLLHAFSEGGANKAVCVAKAHLQMTGRLLPVGAYVFDSTPGTPRFGSNVAAFRRSLPPNPLIRLVGLVFGFAVLSLTWLVFCVFVGYENNALSKTRRALNDKAMWPLAGVPRTYVFSEADDLIWWRDVEEHAEESAREVGVTSLVVRYKSSGHCNHVRESERYYWGAVRQTWEERDVEIGGGVVSRHQLA